MTDTEKREHARNNPPPLTRATIIAAAASAMLMDGEAAPHIAASSASSFVQATRHIWRANGFPFNDDDIREIHASLRRMVKAGVSQRAQEMLAQVEAAQ